MDMNVTIYCGANVGNNPVYVDKTVALGKWIAENNHMLVYGGGNTGLMGVIADSVLEHGGEVVGVIPTFLKEREVAHYGLSRLEVVDSMAERKARMFDLGDVYIALPGGPGTLEEITDVVSWSRIGQNDNPCVFYSMNGFYDSARNLYDDMVVAGFLTQADRDKILFTDSVEEIEDFVATYTPPSVRTY